MSRPFRGVLARVLMTPTMIVHNCNLTHADINDDDEDDTADAGWKADAIYINV